MTMRGQREELMVRAIVAKHAPPAYPGRIDVSLVTRGERIALAAYTVVALAQVAIVFARDGWSADNVTRIAIVVFFVASLAWWFVRRRASKHTAPSRGAFVVRFCINALVVEGCYMVSRPVFASLTVTRETPALDAIRNTLIDFVFTLPAYVVLALIVWAFLQRFRYRVLEYAIVFSLAQSLGDGSGFFVANPALLLFAPWLMLNYQAINVVPYLVARPALTAPAGHPVARVVIPLLVIPVSYWFLGAIIKTVGRAVGLET